MSFSHSSSLSASRAGSPSLSTSSSPSYSPSSSMSSFLTLSNTQTPIMSPSASHPVLSDVPHQRGRSSSHSNVAHVLSKSVEGRSLGMSDTASTRSLSDVTSSRSLRNRRLALIKAIMSLYDTNITRQQLDTVTWPYLADTVVFCDPLVTVRGIDDYKAQFIALRRLFTSFTILELHSSGTNDRLVLDVMVQYKLARYIPIVLHQITILKVSDNGFGVITDHTDMWSFHDMIDSLPIIGKCYTKFRTLFGQTSSWILKQVFHDHHTGPPASTSSSSSSSSSSTSTPSTYPSSHSQMNGHSGPNHATLRHNYATLRL